MTRRLVVSALALTLLVLLVLEIPLGLSFAERQVDDLTSDVERDAFALAGFVEEALEDESEHGQQGSAPPAEGEEIDLEGLADSYQAETGGRVVIVEADGRAVADSDPP